MRTYEEIMDVFRNLNPGEAAAQYKEKTGKGTVGIMPVYCPEEIVHASGFLPMSVWGTPGKAINKARAVWPPFACSVAQSITEMEMDGLFSRLSAVVFSVPCDTLKCLSQKWHSEETPAIVFVHPQNRKDAYDAANVFAREEYRIVKEKLENILGVTITTAAIRESISIYNENRALCRIFSDLAAEYAAVITPRDRHTVLKARNYMRKEEHSALLKELIDVVRQEPAPEFKGKKVVVTGIMTEPADILDVLQENGIAVAADDLAQETRQFREDVPEDEDPLMALAKQWNNFDGCSMATDEKKPKGRIIIRDVEKHKADGVIVCMMKFCDPEEWDYPILLKEFETAGIRSLYIETDLESKSVEQIKTRIQTFAEIL